ncbi:MAG TPA: hypothetical protein VL381_06970 [Rhodocyclaceae bacterium]|nr:hypothetical protein [Rhodocyclaceae bacterium]
MSEREALLKTLLSQALDQLKAGNAEVAVQVLESIVNEQADYADAWYLLGVIAKQSADYASAMTLLTRACALTPNRPDYIAALCEACLGAGEIDQAQACYQLLATISPAHAEALPALLRNIFNGLTVQPLKLLPNRWLFRKNLREIYQQLILYCVKHDVERWWDVAGLQRLFRGDSADVLRLALRTLILERADDAAVFLSLSRALDHIGAAASDEDRSLQRQAREKLQQGAGTKSAPLRSGGDALVSPAGTLNGLLALHMAEMHPDARANFHALHQSAAQIWAAGQAALVEELDNESAYQIMRMLWHFDLLPAACQFLQQTNPAHFLIEVIHDWQRTQAENQAWSKQWRTQHGEAEVYLIGSTVWGKEYIQFFLDYHLPAMLAAGNFPALATRGKVVLSIVTDGPGQQQIESAPIMQAVRQVAELRYSVVTTLPRRDPPEQARLFYMHYGLLEHHHVELARALSANLVLLPVDTVISSHGLQTLAKEISAGHDCCTIAGVESYKSGVLPQLNALRQNTVLSADAATLAQLAMAHPTRYFRSLLVDRKQSLNAYPREFFWQVPGGFICHSIFMHPLILSARVMARNFHPNHENTDWALMPRVMQDDGKAKVLDSSDGLFILHCSEDVARSHEMSPFNGSPTAALGEYLLSVHEHDYPLHRELFAQGMFFSMPAGNIAAQADYAADVAVFKTWFAKS